MAFKLTKFTLGSVVIATFLLSACKQDAQTAAEQQQNFICNALIEGFLNAQKLNEYKLRQIQPLAAGNLQQKIYVYSAQHSNSLNLTPQQAKLRFACQQTSSRQIQIKLHDPQKADNQLETLLSIELPEPQQLKQLTAFSLAETSRPNLQR